jgi:hypothetical protein
MASSTHREWQLLVLSEFKRSRNVERAGTANNQRRTPIERLVENQACRLILRRIRSDYATANLGSELSDHPRVDRGSILVTRFEDPRALGKRLDWMTASCCCGERRLLDELSSSSERHIRLHNSQPQLLPASFARDIPV